MPPTRTPARHPASPHDEALAWFVRRRRGLAAPEREAFEQWQSDPRHRTALQRCEADWDALDRLPPDAVAGLRARLRADARADAHAGRPARSEARRWSLAPHALLAAVVLTVTAGAYLAWEQWARQPLYVAAFTTQRGEQSDLRLPDGTEVRLDTATRAEVALYRDRRELRLVSGQALFHVQADPARPFDVLAGRVRVTVTGTRFSVRHTPDMPGEEGVQVAVASGRVRVSGAERQSLVPSAAAVELGAGERTEGDSHGRIGAVRPVAGAGIAPWTDGRVSFDDAPLWRVLREFERYGHTGLVLNDAPTASLRVTGTFDPRRMDSFLAALPKVLPVRLVQANGATEIAPK